MLKLRFWPICLVILIGIDSCTPKGNSGSSQNSNANTKKGSPSIVTLGETAIPVSDFTYVYEKNNRENERLYTDSSLRAYLDLFIVFRLKVLEAEKLGLDTMPAFQTELSGYRKQLAKPYLTEKDVTEALIQEAYGRMKEEVKASHILINCNPEAEPADTLKAWNQIIELRNRALKGESFEDLAFANSNDPSAKQNKGSLGYFTALQMVYPFENAAYQTPVGQISQPVRTRFGYHLIKVYDRRPAKGKLRVAHIMIRMNTGSPAEDSIDAVRRIQEVYTKLNTGEKWADMVARFSEDQTSKIKDGELPSLISVGKTIPSFEEAAYALQNVGEYSRPIQTPYGWHIIRLLEVIPLEPLETLSPEIKQKVSRDSRSEVNRQAFLERLKKDNALVEHENGLNAALALADSSLLTASWTAKNKESFTAPLFSINKQAYPVSSFLTYVETQQSRKSGLAPRSYMRLLYKQYLERSLIEYEDAHLEQKYPDFKMLVKEYRDGMLLFQLMEEKVWAKAIEDTTGLNTFFNENRGQYQWKERAKAYILSAEDTLTLKAAIAELEKPYFTVPNQNVQFNQPHNQVKLGETELIALEKITVMMKKDPSLMVTVTIGKSHEESLNWTARQDSVVNYFIGKGIAQNRIMPQAPVIGPLRKKYKGTDVYAQDRNIILNLVSTNRKIAAAPFNEKSPLTLQLFEGAYEKGVNEFINKTAFAPGTYRFEHNGRFVFVKITEVLPAMPKELKETRGVVISNYQTALEKTWVEELKQKYPVTKNEAELQKLIKP